MGVATQKDDGVRHIAGVGVRRDMLHTRGAAAPDLVEQAGPAAVAEKGIFTGAQAKHLLQQSDGFLHSPGVGIGAEIPVLPVCGPAVVGHAGIVRRIGAHAALGRTFPPRPALALGRAADLKVGITFVVAKQNVVPGPQRLDEGVFKDQRLGLGSHHRGFQARNLADHEADACAPVVFLEVARHPALKVDGLAHIKHLADGIEKPVNAGQRRQGGRLHRQSGPQTTRAIGGGGITGGVHAVIVGCPAAQAVRRRLLPDPPQGCGNNACCCSRPANAPVHVRVRQHAFMTGLMYRSMLCLQPSRNCLRPPRQFHACMFLSSRRPKAALPLSENRAAFTASSSRILARIWLHSSSWHITDSCCSSSLCPLPVAA